MIRLAGSARRFDMCLPHIEIPPNGTRLLFYKVPPAPEGTVASSNLPVNDPTSGSDSYPLPLGWLHGHKTCRADSSISPHERLALSRYRIRLPPQRGRCLGGLGSGSHQGLRVLLFDKVDAGHSTHCRQQYGTFTGRHIQAISPNGAASVLRSVLWHRQRVFPKGMTVTLNGQRMLPLREHFWSGCDGVGTPGRNVSIRHKRLRRALRHRTTAHPRPARRHPTSLNSHPLNRKKSRPG